MKLARLRKKTLGIYILIEADHPWPVAVARDHADPGYSKGQTFRI